METAHRQGATLLCCWLALALAALILGCASPSPTTGGGAGVPAPAFTPTPVPTHTPTPTPPPDPRAILARAADHLANDRYLEFTLEHPTGSSPLASGLNLVAAEGVASLPDRFRMGLEMEASGSVLRLEAIVVGEDAYMTNLFTGAWEPVPNELIPVRFKYVTESLAALLEGAEAATLVGEVELEGYTAYHIKAVGPTGTLAQLIPGALPDATVPVELWVGKDTGQLRQALIDGPLVAGDLEDTARMVRLKALENPPEIEAPEVGMPGG